MGLNIDWDQFGLGALEEASDYLAFLIHLQEEMMDG